MARSVTSLKARIIPIGTASPCGSSASRRRREMPAMRQCVPIALIVALAPTAALVALVAFPAHADVSGPACVTDGDTLVVNGKRQRTRCVGGTRVKLFGIEAPGDCVTVPTANDPT